MAGLWRAYLRALDTQPVLTKMVTAGTLLVAGDAIAQLAVERRKEYDFARSARTFAFGFAISGPSMHLWYAFLGKNISGTGIRRGIKSTLADQIVFAPFVITTFFTVLPAMEGKSFDEIKEKVKRDFLPALKGNYTLWPAAQLINFTLVPQNLAVLYVSCVAVVWNTWLCYMNAKSDEEANAAKLAAASNSVGKKD